MVNSTLKHLSYKLFPGACQLCLGATDRPSEICSGCEAELPWLTRRCDRCALPLTTPGICGQCLKRPPLFDACYASWEYGFPIDTLISRFKYHGDRTTGALLSELSVPPLTADLLIPVPMHWRRQFARGYNQTEDIARHWSRATAIPACNALKRCKDTPPQQGLSASARRKNLAGAFTVIRPELIRGRTIGLVDDVLTTGATANTLAAILRRAGATSITVCCLARTP
ncbi:ComF family protein [Litorivivens sp.]|uniref:ComF family protein n=1 Tax=Litorivivens sp. TaxID=2020868 RepID=UPI0035646A0F